MQFIICTIGWPHAVASPFTLRLCCKKKKKNSRDSNTKPRDWLQRLDRTWREQQLQRLPFGSRVWTNAAAVKRGCWRAFAPYRTGWFCLLLPAHHLLHCHTTNTRAGRHGCYFWFNISRRAARTLLLEKHWLAPAGSWCT